MIIPKDISVFLILITLTLIVGSVFFSFQKFIIKRDYLIEAKINCYPAKESCFVEECDEGDPRCTNVENYYKFVYKRAQVNLPLEKCESVSGCEVVYCDSDNDLEFSSNDFCSGKE